MVDAGTFSGACGYYWGCWVHNSHSGDDDNEFLSAQFFYWIEFTEFSYAIKCILIVWCNVCVTHCPVDGGKRAVKVCTTSSWMGASHLCELPRTNQLQNFLNSDSAHFCKVLVVQWLVSCHVVSWDPLVSQVKRGSMIFIAKSKNELQFVEVVRISTRQLLLLTNQKLWRNNSPVTRLQIIYSTETGSTKARCIIRFSNVPTRCSKIQW